MIRENSTFIDEGKNILIEEFGKDYGTYFSILSAIADGINTQTSIESALGSKSIGGNLKRLIEDYNVIQRIRPILCKEGTQSVRYEICDNFLRFGFKYIHRKRSLIEIGNYPLLCRWVQEDYTTYSGLVIERYFKQKLSESYKYQDIGSWWDSKGKANEIDIVALGTDKNQAFVYEVKRNKKNYSRQLFEDKIDHLKKKVLPNYYIEFGCLSMEDM